MKIPDDIHILDEEHMVQPVVDTAAVEMYELLRKKNPWLPVATKVLASREMELTWSAQGLASITLTVAIDLPDDLTKVLDQ